MYDNNIHPFQFRRSNDFDIEKYLYHYTTAGTAIDCILPNKTLKFNRFMNLNDPKESRFEDIITIEPSSSNIRPQLVDYFRSQTKAVCFSCDILTDDFCSRGFAKPRMWASYGDNHKGICLVFDKEKLRTAICNNKDNEDIMLDGKISYGPSRDGLIHNCSDFEDAKDYIINNPDYFFFYKHCDWHTENEYRFILITEGTNDQFLSFSDALVGIVVGMEVENSNIDKIIELSRSDIPVIQAIWGMGNQSAINILNPAAEHLRP